MCSFIIREALSLRLCQNNFFFLLDMPSGKVSLTLYNNESVVCSTTVTYFTEMEEICRYLEKATDPMQFMCQVMKKTIG